MKSSLVIALTFLLCSALYSQTESKQHTYALSFGIADNFRLDRFNFDIAVKKIFDDSQQLRLFISPRFSTNSSDESREDNFTVTNNDETYFSIGIGADYLWILKTNADINMFGGPGMVFTLGSSIRNSTTIVHNITDDVGKSDYKAPFGNIGMRGILGVEWMVSDAIGIHSEYIATLSYNWQKYESKNSFNGSNLPGSTRETSGASLYSGVLFGVSIYL